MILIDSSVWIDYFKGGQKSEGLSGLITNNLITTNEIVLTEIIPVLKLRQQTDIIASMLLIKKAPLDVFWLGIRKLQTLNLKNGLNKVGIPDLIIAQQCLDQNLELWTFDKHFKIMAEHLELKLLEL